MIVEKGVGSAQEDQNSGLEDRLIMTMQEDMVDLKDAVERLDARLKALAKEPAAA